MLSDLHSLNLKLCSKQYNKKFVLHLIVTPQLYLTKTRQAGWANEQSMYSLMSMNKPFFLQTLPKESAKALKFGTCCFHW
jgi:hypothetical protein